MTEPGATSHHGAQSGVTLIEVIVALALIALTLAIAGGGFRLLARSGERGAQVVARHDALSRGIDVLRRDIERLERIVWKQGEARRFLFHGAATRLTFVVIEPPFPSEAGPYFVVYSILQRRDGDLLARERAPFQASADIGRLATQDSVAVLEGPYRLRFLYLERKERRERWLPEWSDPYSLPALVGLEVSGMAERGGMVLISFRPRIDAERSCIKEHAPSCTIGSHGVLASEGEAGSEGAN